MHKHKWMYTVKYEPEHFGKKGFTSLSRPTQALNVSDLRRLVDTGSAEMGESGKRVLNLRGLGYDKVLGRGHIDDPVVVVVDKASDSAKRKIEDAGGEVVEDLTEG
jgi:large subunit ribosomal protein L15